MREIWKKFRTKFENQTEADLIDEMNTFLSSTKEVEGDNPQYISPYEGLIV